jgi:hypothetical protein
MWPSYTPRHWVLILVTFYDTHELHWGYSLLPATTEGHEDVNISNKMLLDLFEVAHKIKKQYSP